MGYHHDPLHKPGKLQFRLCISLYESHLAIAPRMAPNRCSEHGHRHGNPLNVGRDGIFANGKDNNPLYFSL